MIIAEVAHLVEHDLAKVGVAGSSPVFRSSSFPWKDFFFSALVVELVDTRDLKSLGTQVPCRFNSCLGHKRSLLMSGLFLYHFSKFSNNFQTMPVSRPIIFNQFDDLRCEVKELSIVKIVKIMPI